MESLLDYVGTNSRIGRKNNIWTSYHFFFINAGEGYYSELSPDRVTFSGSTNFMGITERINLQLELLSSTRCNIYFKGAGRNIPYQMRNDIFKAMLSENVLFSMLRHNDVDTQIKLTVYRKDRETVYTTYHIQQV